MRLLARKRYERNGICDMQVIKRLQKNLGGKDIKRELSRNGEVGFGLSFPLSNSNVTMVRLATGELRVYQRVQKTTSVLQSTLPSNRLYPIIVAARVQDREDEIRTTNCKTNECALIHLSSIYPGDTNLGL